jgi:hypothetical protein
MQIRPSACDCYTGACRLTTDESQICALVSANRDAHFATPASWNAKKLDLWPSCATEWLVQAREA